ANFCLLPVSEVEDKEPILSGHVYFAPRGYHLMSSRERRFHLNVDAPVHCCRPSIDVFFESVALAYGDDAVGVILSGSNADGAEGLRAIQLHGGRVGIQTPEDAEFPLMPEEALKKVPYPDFIGSQNDFGRFLTGNKTP